MSMRFLLGTGVICVFSAATPSAAVAEVPRVVTDIAPVHSLVAQVMAGVGVPDLLIDQATSPHHFALRPSQARALQEAPQRSAALAAERGAKLGGRASRASSQARGAGSSSSWAAAAMGGQPTFALHGAATFPSLWESVSAVLFMR